MPVAENYFSENLVPAHRQQLQCTEVLFRGEGVTQGVVIFRNPRFGTVLALDDVVQTTTHDEFVYHEMIAHVPILAHGTAKRVLIIGGGDGGVLRHALMHQSVEQAVLVEIEPTVIDMTKKYLPTICGDAFDNPRAKVVIADGCAYVCDAAEKYDVIIVDSTDNHGPGAVLFTAEFYADCKRSLNPGGILITQSGVPFTQPDVLKLCRNNLKKSFADVGFYMATIPTYISGPMALGFSSDNATLRTTSLATITERYKAAQLKNLQYYTPAVHVAAFALPQYVENLLVA
jgi:spermidine synthase